jgi:tetratricopeptide (TPR) repeat protein
VALLPAAGQEVLGAAAIVGRRVPRALLLAVAAQPEDAVLAGLEAACRARLLLEEGDDGYTFAHDVIREVVEADVGAARRALLHRRVAEALEGDSGGASPELLAYHYARGGVPDKAVVYLELAGDRAWAQRAQGAAETHYREVLDRLVTLGRTQDAVRVREKLGRVLHGAGRCDAALPLLQEAAEAFRAAGDWESVVRVTAWMGRAHAVRGTVHEGIALITALLERLDRGGTKTPLAALYEALAVLMFTAGRYAESLVAGERAVELARASGDDATLVRAELGRANSVQLLGRLGDALRAYQDVLALAEAVGDFECLVVIPRDLAYFLALRGAFAPSAGYIARSFVLAAQMGNPALLSLTLAIRGWLAVLGGEWPSARADLEEALALSRQVDRSWYSPYPLLFRARLSLVEGAWTDAMVSAQAAVDLAKRNGDLQALRWASGVMAEIEILEGRAEAARARLAPLLDRPGLQECDVTTLLPVLAWAHLELGQVEQAADAVEQALTRAEPEDMRLVVVEVLRVQALIALRREQWGAAARSLAEGLSLARGLPYPYAEARLLHLDGLLHVQQGEPEAARERLEAARAIFARLGARMDLARGAGPGRAVSQRRAGGVMRRR